MTGLQRRPKQFASLGTIGVWLFLMLLFSFSDFLPQKKVYKTVKISLETPSTPKIAQKQDAAPPLTEQIEKAQTPPATASSKSTSASAKKQSNQSTQQKKSSVPATSAKPAPQTLQKSVDEAMAEQRRAKKARKTDFDWSSFDSQEGQTSSASSAKEVSSAKSVDALQGTAGVASSESSAQLSSSNSSDRYISKTSGTTNSSLSKIAATTYSAVAGNGVSSKSTLKTASSPDGKISMIMSDGSSRILIDPKEPRISLSAEAAYTIDTRKELQVKFTVLANGHIDINSISITPGAIVSTVVKREISNQISKWRFNEDSNSATAVFSYTIEKK